MTEQQKARELAKLLTAFADRKQLQIYYSGESLWRDSNITMDVLLFRFNEGVPIRIKPETRRIALNQQDLIDRKLRKETISVIYNKTVKKDENVSLYGYNPSSNGGITVSVGGTWEP